MGLVKVEPYGSSGMFSLNVWVLQRIMTLRNLTIRIYVKPRECQAPHTTASNATSRHDPKKRHSARHAVDFKLNYKTKRHVLIHIHPSFTKFPNYELDDSFYPCLCRYPIAENSQMSRPKKHQPKRRERMTRMKETHAARHRRDKKIGYRKVEWSPSEAPQPISMQFVQCFPSRLMLVALSAAS